MGATHSTPRFYVYVLARPDGSPFYVGKGQGDRVFQHEREANRGCRCHKCKVIRKVKRQGGEVQRYIVFTTNDESEAYAHEVELIALYGMSTLTNHHSGGEGGTNPSPETRHKMSESIKKFWATPDGRAKKAAASRQRVMKPETREKLRQINLSQGQDPEVREKRSLAAKAMWERRSHSASPEAIAKNKAYQQQLAKDPPQRAKRQEISRAYWSRPESREEASKKQKENWVKRRERQNRGETHIDATD